MRLLAFLLLPLALHAQYAGSSLDLSMGYRRAFRLDPFQSDIRQQGHWGGISFGASHRTKKWAQSLELNGHAGLSSSATEGSYPIQDYGGALSYTIGYRIIDMPDRARLYAGLSSLTDVSFTRNTRLGNNEWSWRIASGIGASLHLMMPFSIKRQKFMLNYKQNLPVSVFGAAPAYTIALEERFDRWSDWSSFGGNQIWRSSWDLDWLQSSGNSFGLRYIWQYTQLNAPNGQYAAYHEWGIRMRVTLK